jgi:hypothetical protein
MVCVCVVCVYMVSLGVWCRGDVVTIERRSCERESLCGMLRVQSDR